MELCTWLSVHTSFDDSSDILFEHSLKVMARVFYRARATLAPRFRFGFISSDGRCSSSLWLQEDSVSELMSWASRREQEE